MTTIMLPKRHAVDRLAPQIVELPAQTMAVVHTRGDPNVVGPRVLPALYGAVYTLKFGCKRGGQDFKIGALRARWSGGQLDEAGQFVGDWDQWEAAWALPIPADTRELPRKVPDIDIEIAEWSYGLVAQILHEGSYRDEPPTIARLHAFIAANGYEIAGPHEEEYLTRPNAKVPKTIIRYAIRRAQPG
jgi:hypothetical protein